MEDSKIHLLIIDDDQELCAQLIKYFSTISDINVIGFAYNGLDGYDMFKKYKPDIVLLDLIMPFMDGFSFLDQANEDKILSNSKIIIMSAIRDDKFINQALRLGGDHYMMKPFDMYQIEKRIRKLARNSSIVQIPSSPMPIKQTKQHQHNQIDINTSIAKLLIDSGLPVHTLGYKYFQCAIHYLLQQQSDVFSITKTIYPYIAIKYETSGSCVDKAMRHSINLAYQDNQQMLRYFLSQMNYRDCNAKPSNSEFLNLSVEKIKQDVSTLRT